MVIIKVMIFGAGLAVLAGCGGGDSGGSSQKKSESESGGGTVTRTKNDGPKTSTANTPFALEEGCYRNGGVPEDVCKIALSIFRRTNEKRAAEGKEPLKHHAGWHHVATQWSKDQATAGKISHTGFPDSRWAVYEREFGNDGMPDLAAENVGVVKVPDADDEGIAAALADGWYGSPGHRKNMVGDFKYLGVGVFKTDDEKFFATQLFAWDP